MYRSTPVQGFSLSSASFGTDSVTCRVGGLYLGLRRSYYLVATRASPGTTREECSASLQERPFGTATIPHEALTTNRQQYDRNDPVLMKVPESHPSKAKLLFVCSWNQWRSPTAEALFKDHPCYEARSAGTGNGARVKVTASHLGWADLIFCMEKKHADRPRENFPAELAGKKLVTLGIPDDYEFMDPALLELLRLELSPYLEP